MARCTTGECSAITANTVDDVGQVGRFSSITVGADGLPLISYNDLGNADLKVLACGNVACTHTSRSDGDQNISDQTVVAVDEIQASYSRLYVPPATISSSW